MANSLPTKPRQRRQPVEKKFSFGVGCFAFGLKNAPKQLNVSNYKEIVTRNLLEIKSIKSVKFLDSTNVVFHMSPESNNDDNDRDISDIEPYLERGGLDIELYMPHRVQEDFISGFRSPLDGENININIRFKQGIPIAFISTEKFESNPSTAVMLVWKFFKSEFSKNAEIEFLMLGPSPFHADFYLQHVSGKAVSVKYHESVGYDSVHIELPVKLSQEICVKFFDYRLIEEIKIFYMSILFDLELGKRFDDIVTRIEDNDNFHKPSFFMNLFRRNKGDIYQLKLT